MHPSEISILDFTYELPEERIAKYPLPERDQSRLLLYRAGTISEDIYAHIHEHIPEGALLVFNETKVVEARLRFQKPTGGVIEVFCLEPGPGYHDITSAMLQRERVHWRCLIGGAGKWKHGMVLQKNIAENIVLEARIIERETAAFIVELSWNDNTRSFAEILHLTGAIPLPPYLNREAEASDTERYQTIYAKQEGSVAAPTAGLHFTNKVFDALASKNIDSSFVTLHVGAGTFKPVKSERMSGHDMHAELIDVDIRFIEQLQQRVNGTVIAVGTTSLRTIESLYWIGLKIAQGRLGDASHDTYVQQWDPYEGWPEISTSEALQTLIDWMSEKQLTRLVTKTQIIIAPGYHLKVADGLVTNFHQPQSTLLLLVAAIVGEDWRRIYNHALNNGFRFLSYGDGSLLWKR